MQGDHVVDVLIVGGGIVGVATAHLLASSGLSVAVVEARRLLSGVTGNTTGKLTALHGVSYRRIRKMLDDRRAKLYYEANDWAISFVRLTSSAYDIECDLYAEPAYTYATHDDGLHQVLEEYRACQDLGIPAELDSSDIPFDVFGAIMLDNQARFHPLKFLTGLVHHAMQAGVKFYEDSRVLEVEEHVSGCIAKLEHGAIVCDSVVVATHYPIHDSGWFVAKLFPYRSYALACELDGPLPDCMAISTDTGEIGSFRRAEIDGEKVLICGNGFHKVGQEPDTERCFAELEGWARRHFPVKSIRYHWSNQDNWTADEVPYIGLSPNRKRIFIATGFCGWGMTNGLVAARILTDEIKGVANEWSDVYNPARTEVGTAPTIIKENLNVAREFFGSLVTPADADNLEALEPGQGIVVQLEGERAAAYAKPDGDMVLVSPVCTHLGCQVTWNNAEQTWDCPCHGSRFLPDGTVIQGPAVRPLEPVTSHLEDM
ncbi:MAG: Cytochrome b6-f complex iron-sulfur subunit [Fimbriimonadaceae bacterium]|nr:Cytochrome b6-f complex iron-sulfur subunit [Fimbriimonadaceae bacterium]